MTIPKQTGFFVDATLRRPDGAGSYVDGHWVASTYTDSTIQVSFQPKGPDELLNLPEGQRERNSKKIYSDTELRTVEEGSSPTVADKIIYDGVTYEVHEVFDYSSIGINLSHYKAIILEENA